MSIKNINLANAYEVIPILGDFQYGSPQLLNAVSRTLEGQSLGEAKEHTNLVAAIFTHGSDFILFLYASAYYVLLYY